MFTEILVGIRVHVSFDRYSQDLAYTFICSNEINRRLFEVQKTAQTYQMFIHGWRHSHNFIEPIF
ncbi:hypothetical protein IGI04_030232 [Brassica rapa subsp. trilocularis]|uniref:Uncharacterized protein n=1 Tax=Brassica rapa subsp. trilocularis TaxID=1813537 RepID=A0ABQ7LSG2_BRACM|nr:hypothetical protein IGI04_030232 [Brassica rapa subsp. trilocularis]